LQADLLTTNAKAINLNHHQQHHIIITITFHSMLLSVHIGHPGDGAVKGVFLLPLAYWDCGFEWMSVCCECCEVEVSATG
jgi:hypothetical protein